MYGHQDAALLWRGAPQFFRRAEGTRVWDADGREYVDLMCSFGPIILGHRHPGVEAAVQRQHEQLDCGNGPAEVMVDLAERLVSIVKGAAWCMFAKNGSDVTTLAVALARAHTGRRTILLAEGAYHGWLPWCNPDTTGCLPSDRAHIGLYRYNDLRSVLTAVAAHKDDVAAIIATPLRHDAGFDQELVDPDFARGLRGVCDGNRALLIIDEVRTGLRLNYGGSWDELGVVADLSAWGKAMGNGYPISALLGREGIRQSAQKTFATGSFWFAADAMAAALATLEILKQGDGVRRMRDLGRRLWEAMSEQAGRHAVPIRLTGHATMPYITFPGETAAQSRELFAKVCADGGLYVHPRHNWFMSAAWTDTDLQVALHATDEAFRALASV